ncbi:uncharacterized protein LOC125499823 [Athalia rosae]|uniref:uncharacterized protein LOC125499823 n=1 Tax=Athalia rosae TaxID=37344 RepID=UPI002033F6EC|nr:uncharacterized protein LOC125499823 [Athalia rosae]
MQSESSWAANNRRKYDAYSLRGRKGLHYPPQPAFVRAPRRGPVPGPIRNPINSYRTAPATSSRANILKKTISCPNNAKKKCNITPQIPKLIASKKSLSMVDLSPVAAKSDVANLSRSESAASLQGRSRKANGNLETAAVPSSDVALWTRGLFPESEASMVPGVKSRAASLVCRALVVNAWRRRREENFQLNETIRQFTQQVQHLHIQIVVLRRLLDTENGRVGRLMAEMQQTKLRLEDVARERDHLKSEKEKALQDVSQLRDAVEKKTVSAENLRNELLSVQTHLAALDGQVSKDREKLLKLREDKKMLLEKVMISETLASERLAMKETAESEIEDLRGRLSSQIALLCTTNEQQSKIVDIN